jgi:hypothetical protein
MYNIPFVILSGVRGSFRVEIAFEFKTEKYKITT